MKGARQSSLTTTRGPKPAPLDPPKASFREQFSTRMPIKPLKVDPRKSTSPSRLRSVSPVLSRPKLQERAESPGLAKRPKRPDSGGVRPGSGGSAKRNLGELGKVDLKRGNFSNKQILPPAKCGSLNVSLVEISPVKRESRTPSPRVTRSTKFQQLSKGFKITRTALMQGVDSVTMRTKDEASRFESE